MPRLNFISLIVAVLIITISVGAQTFMNNVNQGDIITVEGEVSEILSPHAFVITNTAPFELAPAQLVIFNDNDTPFAVDVNVGNRVQVSGILNGYSLTNLINRLDYDIDPADFADYGIEDYSLTAFQTVDPNDLPQPAGFDYDPQLASEVNTNPETYFGDSFTIEGYVTEIFNRNSFIISQTEPFSFAPDSLLVLNQTLDDFGNININIGTHVRVTGNLHPFIMENFQPDLTYNFDAEPYEFYGENNYAMTAETVIITSARTTGTTYLNPVIVDNDNITIDMIEDDPMSFVGQTVTIQGEVGERYTDRSFLLEEDEFFDIFPMQIPVFASEDINYDTDGFTLMTLIDGQLYTIVGEVVIFDPSEIESQYNVLIPDVLYADFDENDIAIIATAVTQTEE